MNEIAEQTRIKEITDIQVLPILPLKGMIVYPYLVVPLMIREMEQAKLVDEALMNGSRIGLFLQKNPDKENPGPDDLHTIGTSGNILKMLRFPDGSVRFIIQGLSRIRVRKFVTTSPHLKAEIEEVEEVTEPTVKLEALQRNLIEQIKILVELAPYLNEEFHISAINQESPSAFADFVASNLNIAINKKQSMLSELNVYSRMQTLYQVIGKEIEVLELSQKIQAQAVSELGKSQREYILREQLKAIKRELGDGDGHGELEEFEKKISQAAMPGYAEQAAYKELDRLSHMQPSSAEYTVARTYVDWLVSLPWSVSTADRLDLKKAKQVLDTDHYNLEKVKDRILEYLAVRRLKSDTKGPILCFVGPPGVGKTSLGKSIAKAMGRKFSRVAVGGMRDEAEIRGHRRTYIGAMPGRIIQSIKRCGSNNPIIMLDEIDKLGTDFRGDPASALLEVLDPEQNDSFTDHYLDIAFDLSKVMFITTANWVEPIPPVLRDRMELIHLPGYTDLEKLAIAKRHLVKKQLTNHGLTTSNLLFTDAGIRALIEGYTREAGLRNLEREIAAVARKVARKVASGSRKKISVGPAEVQKLLGPEQFTREVLSRDGHIGVVPGLAYTAAGGDLLYVEATSMPGAPGLRLTGHLGEVMKESAQAALSFIRSNAESLKIDPALFEKNELHVHVPAGATPKDGPSAGITIAVALVSLFTKRPLKARLAMTGEITLRGELLPIGGLKQKLLAAARSGVRTVIIPEGNRKDTVDIPAEIRKCLKLKFFADVFPAIQFALDKPSPKPARNKSKGKKAVRG